MTINAQDFRAYVLKPALTALSSVTPPTQVAADLLMATAAVETQLGTYLSQVGGPARGVFQIEPASFTNLWEHLAPGELVALRPLMTPQNAIDQLDGNLVFAAAIARLFYWQVPQPLPERTADGLWWYYKVHWNSMAGATTGAKFVAALRLTDIVF
jgi:hypothetical protein